MPATVSNLLRKDKRISYTFAKLEIIGDIVAQPDYFDDVKFTGLVKNTGTKGLIFGEVYLISEDLLGSILDIDFSFIDGETVTLESLGSTTDTALNINSQGSFSIFTSIPLSSYNSTQPKYSWDDADIQGGIAMMAEKQVSTDSIPNLSKRDQLIRRNEKIEQLRETLLR